MARSGWNPIQNDELRLPADYEWLKALTKTAGGDAVAKERDDADVAPFPRLVDAWLLAVALGARFGRADDPLYDPPTHTFERGSRLAGMDDAIKFLHLVALGELRKEADFVDDPEGAAYCLAEEPSRVVLICNELAARGLPVLREMLEEKSSPLASLAESLMRRLPAPPEADSGLS